jgi:hypothetical protein
LTIGRVTHPLLREFLAHCRFVLPQSELKGPIDGHSDLLQFHRPFHESEDVLNVANNLLCEATCLQEMDLRRKDGVFLDALTAPQISDHSGAKDFCRRFTNGDINIPQSTFNDVRRGVSNPQSNPFFELHILP